MDSQTSFIPKRPLAKDAVVHEESIGLFTLLATLIFFISLLGGIGTYFYKILLERQITDYSATLDRAEKAFDPTLIVELERLDKRIESAKQILNNHIVISPLFKMLENSTIPLVRFGKFNYGTGAENQIEISMAGQARSYAYVVVQSDVLGANKYLKEHIFSNLNLDNSGNVTFDLFAVVDPALLSYKSFVDNGGDLQQ